MIFKKILITLIVVGGAVFGALQLGSVQMPDAHQFCGQWG